MKGHNKIVEMLLLRGARVSATNRGDDTPLHLAAAHGHREIVHMVRNTLHLYSCIYVMHSLFFSSSVKEPI